MSEPKMPWGDVDGGFLRWLSGHTKYWDQFARGLNTPAFGDLRQIINSAVRSGYEQGLAEQKIRIDELEGLLREIRTRLAHAGYCQGVSSMTRGDHHMEAQYREEVEEFHAKIDAALHQQTTKERP